MPLHPRTKSYLESHNIRLEVKIIEPQGYFDMLSLLKHCKLVMTDSGGLQKEAYFFQKNCITLRDQTEWVELVRADVNTLTGADQTAILSAFRKLESQPFLSTAELYGKGNAASLIAKKLQSH